MIREINGVTSMLLWKRIGSKIHRVSLYSTQNFSDGFVTKPGQYGDGSEREAEGFALGNIRTHRCHWGGAARCIGNKIGGNADRHSEHAPWPSAPAPGARVHWNQLPAPCTRTARHVCWQTFAHLSNTDTTAAKNQRFTACNAKQTS